MAATSTGHSQREWQKAEDGRLLLLDSSSHEFNTEIPTQHRHQNRNDIDQS
jgi:hypothetical protein